MRNLIYLLPVIVFTLSGCRPRPKMIRLRIDGIVSATNFAKYKKIAVLPFSDAPNAPRSGRKIQDITIKVLKNFGFEVTKKTQPDSAKHAPNGALDLSGLIETGKKSGVDAIVMGEVGQYETKARTGEAVYINISKTILPGQRWVESYVSISLKIIDTETGKEIYSGSGEYEKGIKSFREKLARNILNQIVLRWFKSPGTTGFIYNYGNMAVTKIYDNSPAEAAGVEIGDKIIKIDGQLISDLSRLQQWSLTWGHPGGKIVFELERGPEILTKEIIRADRGKFYKEK